MARIGVLAAAGAASKATVGKEVQFLLGSVEPFQGGNCPSCAARALLLT